MKKAALLFALALITAPVAAPHAAAAPTQKGGGPVVDWSKRVAQTPEGGFVMGNPAA